MQEQKYELSPLEKILEGSSSLSPLEILKEKAPHIIERFKRYEATRLISADQAFFLSHSHFLSALSYLVAKEKFNIEPERLIEATRGITGKVGLLEKESILKQVLGLVVSGNITFVQFIEQTRNITPNQIPLLSNKDFFSELSSLVLAQKITFLEFINETREMNMFAGILFKTKRILEKTLTFVMHEKITLKQVIEKINQFSTVENSQAGKYAAWVRLALLHNERIFDKFLTSVAKPEIKMSEQLIEDTANLTELHYLLLTNEAFLDRLFTFVDANKVTLNDFIKKTAEVEESIIDFIPADVGTENDTNLCRLKTGLCLLVNVLYWGQLNVSFNQHQLIGILYGLDRTQVDHPWFGEWHAKLAEREEPYENYQGLTEYQAKGVYYGLTRLQVNHSWFGEWHAKLAERKEPYENYQDLTKHQARGLYHGLTRLQVNQPWFGDWHAELAERKQPYENYQALTEHQAKGVYYGLTRLQVDQPWFGKWHAELAEKRVPYKMYEGITNEEKLVFILLSITQNRFSSAKWTEYEALPFSGTSDHASPERDDEKQIPSKPLPLSSNQTFWNSSSSTPPSSTHTHIQIPEAKGSSSLTSTSTTDNSIQTSTEKQLSREYNYKG